MGRFTLGHLALAASVGGSVHAAVPSPGKPECPCLMNTSSTGYQNVKEKQGDEWYGLQGCQAYDGDSIQCQDDENKKLTRCGEWCFVDMTRCTVNKTSCEAAGGQVGSFDFPHCRDRPTIENATVGAHYSYETCGYLEVNDVNGSVQQLANKVMTVAPVDDVFGRPWVMLRPGANTYTRVSSTGVLFDLFFDSLNTFLPDDKIKFKFSKTTSESMARIGSRGTENTACCHDVGIGNVDVCIGDIWRLPDRELRASFSPTVMDDRMYLVVQRDDSEDSVAWFLGRPFWPFKTATWGALVGWLFAMTVVLWGLRAWQKGFAAFRNEAITSSFTNFIRDNIELWDDFLHGQVQVGADTFAHRWFRLGFQFFVLVLMSSYTASLASMLVWRKPALGKVASIDEAIKERQQICGSYQLESMMEDMYKGIRFKALDHSKDGPRMIYKGDCDAIILSERLVEELHGGGLKERDCKLLEKQDLSKAEAHCELGFGDEPRNDCIFTKVGEILFTIPVAFPVSERYAHPVSLAITQYLFSGGLDTAKQQNAYAALPSQCDAAKVDSAGGLSVQDLGGTFAISFIVIAFGILVCLVEAACDKALSALRAPAAGSAPPSVSETSQHIVIPI